MNYPRKIYRTIFLLWKFKIFNFWKECYKIKEIKSANDIIVVPVSYFNGMEKELQKILNKVDIHDMDVMEQVLHMRKWLKTKTVYEETKRLYPNLRLENIYLLLPQEDSDERGDKG